MVKGGHSLTKANQTPKKYKEVNCMQTEIRRKGDISKGKEPRSLIKVCKRAFRGKGSEDAKTSSRLAWKQPSFKERVKAH